MSRLRLSLSALPSLWSFREHSAGLNCGRWDYIFSFIKKFRAHKDKVLPDRSQVTMVAPVRLFLQISRCGSRPARLLAADVWLTRGVFC